MERTNIFDIDYKNLEQVIALANKLAPGQAVTRYLGQDHYTITSKNMVKTCINGIEVEVMFTN